MPKPSKTALGKHPRAVIMLAATKDEPNAVGDFDFEWFDTPEGQDEFWVSITKWATADIKDEGDLVHLVAEVVDTKVMALGRVETFGTDDADGATWKQNILDDPSQLVYGVAASKGAVAKPAAKKVTPAVRGRKPTTAAAVVKGPVEAGNAPKPKPKVRPARKPATDGPKPAAEPKAAALKQRLKDKQAAAAAPVVDDAEMVDLFDEVKAAAQDEAAAMVAAKG